MQIFSYKYLLEDIKEYKESIFLISSWICFFDFDCKSEAIKSSMKLFCSMCYVLLNVIFCIQKGQLPKTVLSCFIIQFSFIIVLLIIPGKIHQLLCSGLKYHAIPYLPYYICNPSSKSQMALYSRILTV